MNQKAELGLTALPEHAVEEFLVLFEVVLDQGFHIHQMVDIERNVLHQVVDQVWQFGAHAHPHHATQRVRQIRPQHRMVRDHHFIGPGVQQRIDFLDDVLGDQPRIHDLDDLAHRDQLAQDRLYRQTRHAPRLGRDDALPAERQRPDMHAPEIQRVKGHAHREPVGRPAHEGRDERNRDDLQTVLMRQYRVDDAHARAAARAQESLVPAPAPKCLHRPSPISRLPDSPVIVGPQDRP